MPQTSEMPQPKKHMKAFWPLTIIFVCAVIAASLIYWFQFSLETDYDLQSIVFSVHKRDDVKKPAVKKVAPAKTGTTTPTGQY